MNLPELPPPDGSADVVVGSEQINGIAAEVLNPVDAWSKPLVIAYGRACYLKAIEDAERSVVEVGPQDGPLKLVTEGFAAAIRALAQESDGSSGCGGGGSAARTA